MITLKMNGGTFHSETVNGQSFEVLDQTSEEILQAIASDTVGQFVASHPAVVNNDASNPLPTTAKK